MSILLIGEYNHNIDAKGRLSVPAKFRDEFGSSVILGRGADECLRLYSLEEFETFKDNLLSQLDTSDEDDRDLYRYFTAKVDRCDFDSQGRIIVSKKMRDYAGLTKEVVVIGNGNVAEIWDKALYDERFSDDKFTSEQVSKKIKQKKIRF
ncbi:MAG: division/cell wall cluster transcriptional repressor MraZ [Eubacterium sp.]|nr:division/cell wall cluster transcriptional repressor MraZ [Eubacterium sp.]